MKTTLITPKQNHYDEITKLYDIKDCLEAVEGGFELTLVKAKNKKEAQKKI